MWKFIHVLNNWHSNWNSEKISKNIKSKKNSDKKILLNKVYFTHVLKQIWSFQKLWEQTQYPVKKVNILYQKFNKVKM